MPKGERIGEGGKEGERDPPSLLGGLVWNLGWRLRSTIAARIVLYSLASAKYSHSIMLRISVPDNQPPSRNEKKDQPRVSNSVYTTVSY